MLGAMHETAAVQHALGVVFVVCATAFWVAVQSFLLQLRATEHESRWASNLRDIINFASSIALAAAFRVTGLPFPAAILFAGSLGILIDILRHTRADQATRQRRALIVTISLSLA